MPRKSLTPAEKTAMQDARKANKEARAKALTALEGNSPFTDPKFWEKVPSETAEAVKDAIGKAQTKALKNEVEALEAALAAKKALLG